jgi:hypothetical protein
MYKGFWIYMNSDCILNLKGVYKDGKLTIPLDKREGAPKPPAGSVPLRFGYLSGFSKVLDEIHTVHAINGESGSVIYPWAGLTKWVAYAPVPYHTGEFYDDKLGFTFPPAISNAVDKSIHKLISDFLIVFSLKVQHYSI